MHINFKSFALPQIQGSLLKVQKSTYLKVATWSCRQHSIARLLLVELWSVYLCKVTWKTDPLAHPQYHQGVLLFTFFILRLGIRYPPKSCICIRSRTLLFFSLFFGDLFKMECVCKVDFQFPWSLSSTLFPKYFWHAALQQVFTKG